MKQEDKCLVRSVDIARKAIPFMSENSIPINPHNYHVWYEYFRGRMIELKVTLEELLETKIRFDDQINEEIFNRFFTRSSDIDQENNLEKEINAFDDLNIQAEKILEPASEQLARLSDTNEQYGEKLKEAASEFGDDKINTELYSIMKALAKETDKVSQENLDASSSLKDTFHQLSDLRLQLAEARAEARLDALTKLRNRRAHNESIEQEHKKVKATNGCSVFALMDIDLFKRINDLYGHPVGDNALRAIGAQLRKLTRENDEIFRYGGEEFSTIMTGCSLDTAIERLNSIRETIGGLDFAVNDSFEVLTISIGVAAILPGRAIEESQRLADVALYLAKDSGRNNVKSEKDL